MMETYFSVCMGNDKFEGIQVKQNGCLNTPPGKNTYTHHYFLTVICSYPQSPDQKAEPVDLLPPPEVETAVEEERALCRHIQSIKKEKLVL